MDECEISMEVDISVSRIVCVPFLYVEIYKYGGGAEIYVYA